MFHETRVQFNANTVLKARTLQESADYAREMLEHIYASYSDGIVEGVEITADNTHLSVHPGIIKHNNILYHTTETIKIPYEHNYKLMYLRIRFTAASQNEEQVQYTTEIILSDNENTFPYEMELGRFWSEEGAVLHTEYKNMSSVFTRYNQFDIRYVPYANVGESTVSPKITSLFAQELWDKQTDNVYDIAFAMQGLSKKTVSRDVICRYLSKRLGKQRTAYTNEQICQDFSTILKQPDPRSRFQTARMQERRIIVD